VSQKSVLRKDIVLIAIPCPCCSSWNTIPIDKKKLWWYCGQKDCGTPFVLKKHFALLLMKDGSVVKMDEEHRIKIN